MSNGESGPKEYLQVRPAVALSILGFLVLCFAFYWLAYRPQSIRSTCAVDASTRAYYASKHASTTRDTARVMAENDDFNAYYLLCVRSKGIAN